MQTQALQPAIAPTDSLPGTREHLVLALLSVDGASAACATHGDGTIVTALTAYYALVADAVRTAGGRVVKVLGDGVLLAFPAERAREAVEVLRTAQARGTTRWRQLDPRCVVVVKAGAGEVLSLRLGPPGDERPDLYGHALNQLYKVPPGDFVITPDLHALLDRY
jgi:class 3 adenylate cyclase